MLHLITPISRPHNLPRIYDSIRRGLTRSLYAWWCIFDPRAPLVPLPRDWRGIVYWGPGPNRPGSAGYPQRNWALEHICTGWVYFLDDDNLIHPALEKTFQQALDQHPRADWFLFRQIRPDGTLYLAPHCPPRVGLVDIGQGIIRREAIAAARFEEDRYDADGRLFESLAPSITVYCIDQVATYYNALR